MQSSSRRDVGGFWSLRSLWVGKNSSCISPTMGSPMIRYTSQREMANSQKHVNIVLAWGDHRAIRSLEGFGSTAAYSERPKLPHKYPLVSKCPQNGRGRTHSWQWWNNEHLWTRECNVQSCHEKWWLRGIRQRGSAVLRRNYLAIASKSSGHTQVLGYSCLWNLLFRPAWSEPTRSITCRQWPLFEVTVVPHGIKTFNSSLVTFVPTPRKGNGIKPAKEG